MIKKILKGYYNFIRNYLGFISKEEKIVYDYRYKICLKCKYLTKTYFCKLCSCYVPAKVAVYYDIDKDGNSINGCPKKYW